MSGSALAAALRATTPEALRSAGAYDALVIGSGAAGGLAALLLAEAGLRVLVLEAGLARLPIGSGSRHAGPIDLEVLRRRQPIQSRCYAWRSDPKAFVDDLDCPYITPPGRPFVWLRARQPGGRMVIPLHGRQYYRLAPDNFVCTDGLSPPWPLRAAELDPWYAFVERRLGLRGMRDKVPWLPDSELSYVLSPSPAEAALQRAISERWPGARPVLGRFAPPFDALEAAARTGRLLIRTGAIAREIEVDRSGHVLGVVWIDQQTRSEEHARAPLVFLCASALESTRLLLLSRSARSPGGLGAASGVLGRYLMDHVKVEAKGWAPPLSQEAPSVEGRCLYLPRFDAREFPAPRPGPGFGVQVQQQPTNRDRSYFVATSFAEMLPRPENRVTLDPERRDAWGIPVLRIDCSHGDGELMLAREQIAALRELAEVAGVTPADIDEAPAPPGSANHETGTARMGSNPASSVLDPHNQCWEAQGLYVTDGACFPSQGTQNPTLTILALTARACNHAMRTARDNAAGIPYDRAETTSVLSRLQSVGVKLCSDIAEIKCDVLEPTPGFSPAPPALVAQADPLVSCLMMTRGNIELMKYSLACYKRQTYAHRELVVVAEPEAGEKVRNFIGSQEVLNATVFVAPPGLTLGDHRNLAAARARGAVLITWDDDDLSDPRRLDTTINVLLQSGAAAALLSRLLIWWPQRKVAAITERWPWEPTIAAWRSYMPIYAPLPRGGDSPAIDGLIRTHRIALVDCPLLYVYVVTGRNTWNALHFEKIFSGAECVFEGDQFDELNELLSDRLPLLDYAAMLSDDGAVKILG